MAGISGEKSPAVRVFVGYELVRHPQIGTNNLDVEVFQTAPQIERKLPPPPNSPLTALEAFAALSELRPANAVLVNETASNFGDLAQYWPINEPGSYYTLQAANFGWGEPAAVGVTIAQKKLETGRPVIAAIGDGSYFQYSVQSLYTAAPRETKAHLHRPLQRRVRDSSKSLFQVTGNVWYECRMCEAVWLPKWVAERYSSS